MLNAVAEVEPLAAGPPSGDRSAGGPGRARAPREALSRRITDRNILWVMAGGFGLVMLLLAIATLASAGYVRAIRDSAAALLSEQLTAARLINTVQREQGALSAVFHRLSGDPESLDANEMMAQLDSADQAIQNAAAAAAGTPEERLWKELGSSAGLFASQLRAYLQSSPQPKHLMAQLVDRHEHVLGVTSRLIAASHNRSLQADREIARQSRRLAQQSVLLLGACLVLSLLTAVLTIRMTTRLFRRMEWQAGELSRVSWQMLERQEDAARRFSHELHDELGQSLTAVKANLAAVNSSDPAVKSRKEDCLRLVDEAVGNVRELSQLLRPIILDDFGLDAALRWLADRFTTRTGIQVDCRCDLAARLPGESETHLFRIAQEALTNVARHAQARRVDLSLRCEGERVRLRIRDDGRGLPPDKPAESGLGMVGMRARARSAGGELTIRSKPGEGLEIEATVPAANGRHDEVHATSSAG